jgi:hypothetical protein
MPETWAMARGEAVVGRAEQANMKIDLDQGTGSLML